MRRYLEHIHSKEPHERRRHALQIAGVLMGVFVIAWFLSFSARFDTGLAQQQAEQDSAAQTAAVQNAYGTGDSQLQVATTSVYSY